MTLTLPLRTCRYASAAQSWRSEAQKESHSAQLLLTLPLRSFFFSENHKRTVKRFLHTGTQNQAMQIEPTKETKSSARLCDS